jgi:hypothetical protein
MPGRHVSRRLRGAQNGRIPAKASHYSRMSIMLHTCILRDKCRSIPLSYPRSRSRNWLHRFRRHAVSRTDTEMWNSMMNGWMLEGHSLFSPPRIIIWADWAWLTSMSIYYYYDVIISRGIDAVPFIISLKSGRDNISTDLRIRYLRFSPH